ncbi:hypothetical protein [Streptomyces sp. DW26H14]|uniref:hypothetical protein n=1 Tax=Streptomyces sp. DW26H14 TaxID=3435395 RepID=UPI00403DAE71
MSTDFRKGQGGPRLRELRAETIGREPATRLDRPQSKVSKPETGRQTATTADLTVWAEATGHVEATAELHARLSGLESYTRSWRRSSLAGTTRCGML